MKMSFVYIDFFQLSTFVVTQLLAQLYYLIFSGSLYFYLFFICQ